MSSFIPGEWNGINLPFPRERSVLDFFRAQVQAKPDGIAIEDGTRLMTYKELDVCSNRAANELLRQGLSLEEPVAVMLPMSCDFIVAILGALKAGGCYVPIAPDFPEIRLRFVLEDCGARFVITDKVGAERLQNHRGSVLMLASVIGTSGAETDRDPALPSNPGRRAYITYTSGSTGQPKGVEVEHHSWTNYVFHYHHHLGITNADRSSLFSYVSFDASVGEIWPVLTAGGCLVVPPGDLMLDPDRLISWLAAKEITLSFISTGMAEILILRPWPKEIKLRWFITGGDRLRVRPPPA